MRRGIERRAIFRDGCDRGEFIGRLARQATTGAVAVYAWSLLPNHAHLLLRTGTAPLARSMRARLAGYGGGFNRPHRPGGHLFPNRDKSIVGEDEPYLLELVRYLHLNPLRAGLVPDLRSPERSPWSGHAALLGRHPHPWQATAEVLGWFGRTPAPSSPRMSRRAGAPTTQAAGSCAAPGAGLRSARSADGQGDVGYLRNVFTLRERRIVRDSLRS